MSNSFKIQKGGNAKQQARSGGIFLAILGLITALLILPIAGWIMVVVGLIFFAASFAASE
jgi:hypothetical protein